MRRIRHVAAACITVSGLAFAGETRTGESPADHLPAHIAQLTSFGERAD
jgi:hypothetical protein